MLLDWLYLLNGLRLVVAVVNYAVGANVGVWIRSRKVGERVLERGLQRGHVERAGAHRRLRQRAYYLV